MSEEGLRAAQEKMRAAAVASTAIDVFTHYYHQLEDGATGLISEASIAPLRNPQRLVDVAIAQDAARDALAQTVVIKLNGGLGTSMGLDSAKTLLPVREGATFLDLIAMQVRHARATWGVRLPLLFMNSFRTHEDTFDALQHHPDLPVDGLPMDFLQNQEPKLLASDLTPVSWPDDPSLEWCPPGHGDLYSAILASGVLGSLVEQGYRYAVVSNADNLGAAPDARLAGWFAASGAPYAAEVCRRTPADRKGGHLAIRRSDGRLILRESAQTAADDLDAFTDESRHAYFNTNTMWIDLRAVHDALTQHGPVLGLPLIRNVKTVDPTDPRSPKVIQIETAMGAAIEVFEGATAIEVRRHRFLPVKTTNDLLVLRSDAYTLGPDGIPRLATDEAPLVDLDPRYYRTIGGFDARFPAGPPSLRAAQSLSVRGDWTFEANVVVTGVAALADAAQPRQLAAGSTIGSLDTSP